ncbi:flagellar basal body P-ring formation protein FlgA [Pseudomonas sp. TMW22091]|nr:flagellar basal body P-ring formation protein FlgA [Pseudomonas sp. TMW22091]
MKSRDRSDAVSLPPFRRLAQRCGTVISAFAVASLIGLLPVPRAMSADDTYRAQIDDGVRRYFTQRLSERAADQGWQGLRFTQKVFALPTDLPGLKCPQPLQVEAEQQPSSVLGRKRVRLTCAGQPASSITVTAQATVFIRAVVATQVLEREEPISEAMLTVREVSLGKQDQAYFNRIDQVEGLSAKRRIRADQALTQEMLTSPWLVRRGQRVTMQARHGAIQANTEGEALTDGRKGDVIRVKNVTSGKIIEAQVTGVGVVSSTY